jgi:hypothetical protein
VPGDGNDNGVVNVNVGGTKPSTSITILIALTLLADADPALFEEKQPSPPVAAERLAGSALSPATWRQTFAFFRNRGGSP